MPSYLRFNGTSDYARIEASQTLLWQETIYSLEAWISTTKSSGTMSIVNKDNDTNVRDIQLRLNNGKVEFIPFFDTGNVNLLSTTTVSDGNMHQIVATVDTTTVKIYIDGVLNAETTHTGTQLINPTEVFFGRYVYDGVFCFDGIIANIRYYNKALTLAEISYNFSNPRNATSGYTGQWLMNEGTGQTLNDTTINQVDAILIGGTWVTLGVSDGSGVISGTSNLIPADIKSNVGTGSVKGITELLSDETLIGITFMVYTGNGSIGSVSELITLDKLVYLVSNLIIGQSELYSNEILTLLDELIYIGSGEVNGYTILSENENLTCVANGSIEGYSSIVFFDESKKLIGAIYIKGSFGLPVMSKGVII